MAVNGIEIPNLIISKSEPLFEVFDHLLDLPSLRVILDHIDGRQIKIRTDQINGFLPLLFYDDHCHFSQILDVPNELGNLESLGFPIHEKGNLSIGRSEGQQGRHLRLFPMHPKDGSGSELRDHMIATRPTDFDQCFRPVPTIGQHVEFTRDRESKLFKDSFRQVNLRLEVTTSLGRFRVIEFGPEGEKKVLIEQSKEDPLVAKDIGFLSMISVPGTSGNLFSCLLGNRVIHDKKDDGMGFDPQGMEELFQSGLGHFLHGPDVLSKESGEAGQ